jgi:hypothetical protein
MKSLVPGAFYWARSGKHAGGHMTIVQVSTIFGEQADYWTLALVGSDQHHMIGDFDIVQRIEPPVGIKLAQAAE